MFIIISLLTRHVENHFQENDSYSTVDVTLRHVLLHLKHTHGLELQLRLTVTTSTAYTSSGVGWV